MIALWLCTCCFSLASRVAWPFTIVLLLPLRLWLLVVQRLVATSDSASPTAYAMLLCLSCLLTMLGGSDGGWQRGEPLCLGSLGGVRFCTLIAFDNVALVLLLSLHRQLLCYLALSP